MFGIYEHAEIELAATDFGEEDRWVSISELRKDDKVRLSGGRRRVGEVESIEFTTVPTDLQHPTYLFNGVSSQWPVWNGKTFVLPAEREAERVRPSVITLAFPGERLCLLKLKVNDHLPQYVKVRLPTVSHYQLAATIVPLEYIADKELSFTAWNPHIHFSKERFPDWCRFIEEVTERWKQEVEPPIV